jgi:hypothetical protein
MGTIPLPIDQMATQLNADGTAFEITVGGKQLGCAIAGIADSPSTPRSAALYGQAGGAYPVQSYSLQAAVAGQTNIQSFSGVCGASQYGPGVYGAAVDGDGIQGWSQSNQHAGVSGTNTSGGYGVWANSPGGVAVWGQSGSADGVHGESQSNQHAGVSGINNSGGKAGQGGPGVYGSSSNLDGVQGWSQSSHNAGVSGTNSNGGLGVWANSPNGIAIYGQGKTAGSFNGDVNINGTVTVSGDVILSGADFAEDFGVVTTDNVEPGTVMVLGEHGTLRPSEKSYDRKVAGVISGAGDYKPGLILDRQTSAECRLPLAMVGKVWCKADAQYGAIGIGDLLTTSPTSGHAMRADDPSQAFGAVIGKALRPLDGGQGLIPILVALQ